MGAAAVAGERKRCGEARHGSACGHCGLSLAVARPPPVGGCGGHHAGHCGGSEGGSADVPGTAARLREQKKHRKYGATVDRVGGCFRAAVMERFGAVGDDMQAM
eukprot:6943804-Prymnesium_polylepis.1